MSDQLPTDLTTAIDQQALTTQFYLPQKVAFVPGGMVQLVKQFIGR